MQIIIKNNNKKIIILKVITNKIWKTVNENNQKFLNIIMRN